MYYVMRASLHRESTDSLIYFLSSRTKAQMLDLKLVYLLLVYLFSYYFSFSPFALLWVSIVFQKENNVLCNHVFWKHQLQDQVALLLSHQLRQMKHHSLM